MKFLAWTVLGIAGIFAVIGVFTLIVPLVGGVFLGLAALCYFAGQALRRKARELEVRRQLGSRGLF